MPEKRFTKEHRQDARRDSGDETAEKADRDQCRHMSYSSLQGSLDGRIPDQAGRANTAAGLIFGVGSHGGHQHRVDSRYAVALAVCTTARHGGVVDLEVGGSIDHQAALLANPVGALQRPAHAGDLPRAGLSLDHVMSRSGCWSAGAGRS